VPLFRTVSGAISSELALHFYLYWYRWHLFNTLLFMFHVQRVNNLFRNTGWAALVRSRRPLFY